MYAVIIFIFFAATFNSLAAPKPKWAEADAPARMIIEKPRFDPFALVSLPASIDGAPVAEIRAWYNSNKLDARIVWSDPTNLFALVNCNAVDNRNLCAIYLLPGNVPAQPATDVDKFNPTPVRAAFRRAFGQDSPESFAQFLMLESRADNRVKVFPIASIGAINSYVREEFKDEGDWERNSNILRATTWLLLKEPGRWVFTLKGPHAAWLRLDDSIIAEQTFLRGRKEWVAGTPVELGAGLHRLTLDVVRMVRRGPYEMEVAWNNPALAGEKIATTMVPFTGGSVLTEGRLEYKNRDLHAWAKAIPQGGSYRFIGNRTIFMPVRLQNSSVSWENEPMKCEWFDGTGRILGNANELDTVIYGEDLRSAIDLVVADSKGNAATNTATVILDQTPVKEYGVSSSLHGVPAYVYEDDPVQPEIQLRATSPDYINFNVRTRLTLNSGSVITTNEVINLIRSWGRLLLPQVRVGECVELEWQVAHGGVVLHEHKWVFDTAPFDKWPDNVNGLSLSRDGEGITYIARLASYGSIHRLNKLAGAQPSVLLLDGFLADESSPATLANNQNNSISTLLTQHGSAATGLNIDCRYVHLQDLESTDNNGGAGRLLVFTRLQSYLPADIVLLAPALDGYRFGETAADFERRLAALAGLLSMASDTGLVLVIPPAFDILPGCGCKSEKSGAPCRHAAEVSQLAESVMRVADAYGLPVVDLYTIFRVATSDQTLVKDGYLTPSGIETAAAAITREICR